MPNNMTSRQTELLQQRLAVLSTSPTREQLPDGLRGIEKESLRVTRDGMIAFTRIRARSARRSRIRR